LPRNYLGAQRLIANSEAAGRERARQIFAARRIKQDAVLCRVSLGRGYAARP
jgi:hypothetical protein